MSPPSFSSFSADVLAAADLSSIFSFLCSINRCGPQCTYCAQGGMGTRVAPSLVAVMARPRRTWISTCTMWHAFVDSTPRNHRRVTTRSLRRQQERRQAGLPSTTEPARNVSKTYTETERQLERVREKGNMPQLEQLHRCCHDQGTRHVTRVRDHQWCSRCDAPRERTDVQWAVMGATEVAHAALDDYAYT